MKKNILWTGSEGFVGKVTIKKLLDLGHSVWGIDNFSKYGKSEVLNHPNYHFIEGDAKNADLLKRTMASNKINIFIGAAAVIGGIRLVHEYPYSLLEENEGITLAAFHACMYAYREINSFERIIVISSSMVYESAESFPIKESDLSSMKPPKTTYGFQKLMSEYYARSLFKEHYVPFTILRLFNVIGKNENTSEPLNHVIPDFVTRILKGEYPLKIFGTGQQLRNYTNVNDIAGGICECITNVRALNEDFNLATEEATSVLDLAKMIFNKIYPDREFKYTLVEGYQNDVQKNVTDTTKLKNVLKYTCSTSLSESLDTIIPWIKKFKETSNC